MHFDKDELLITNGGSEALLFAMMATCDPGDKLLIPEPFYTNYNGFGQCVNVGVAPITTKAENGFHLPSKEEILSKIDDKVKAILLSNPGNPTGAIYSKEELEMIAEIAIEKDLWIISDEVYREFVYDGLEYTSFGNLKQVEDRVIIIDSVSINVGVAPITTKAEYGFNLPSKDEILSKIAEKVKAILLSNPGNPTGAIYSKEELEMIAEIAIEKELWLISDEVYREFVYDGLEYTSFGNLKQVEDRVIIIDSVSKRYSACGAVIIIDSVSKRYSACGARIGSIASKNKELIAQIMKLCQGRLCVPTLEQVGAVELYKTPVSYFKEVNDEYRKRRDVLYSELMKVDGVICEKPTGAFYIVAKLPVDKVSYFKEVNDEYRKRRDVLYSELMKVDGVICEKPTGAFYIVAKLPVDNAEDFVKWMLTEFRVDNETVMATPAEGFYATPGLGRDEIRLAYILKEEDLRKAAKILKEGLEAYVKLNK